MNINISEDEIILMIRKGNEEALRLLFSIYETKMRFESRQFERKYKIYEFSADDYYQEIIIHFLDVIKKYDFNLGKLYSFWMLLMYRHISYKYKKKVEEENVMARNYDVEYAKYKPYSCSSNDNIFYLKTEYDSALDEFNEKVRGGQHYIICVKMWSQGYSYDEIANILNMPRSKVNYYVSRGLSYLRKKFNKKL